jgi:tetratricopeptide (TPR) repeat protein
MSTMNRSYEKNKIMVFCLFNKGGCMGFLKIFSCRTPEELEKKGDKYAENLEYGLAIIEYEKALGKLDNKSSGDPDYRKKLVEKVVNAKEALARLHVSNGEDLISAGVFDEAEELFDLASGLTEDKELALKIENRLKEIKEKSRGAEEVEIISVNKEDEEEEFIHTEDEHFNAIISSLPPEENKDYQSYGDNFKAGYVALHNGDFKTADEKLSLALNENQNDKSFIPIELATVKINLGMHDNALELLKGFIINHPTSTRAYTLICETLWERKDFDHAENLLSSCLPEISESVPVMILKGETCFYQKKFDEAVSIYLGVIEKDGWDEHIARFLAKTYEARGLKEEARSVYGEIMGKCQGCGKRSDPYIMQRYAENSFALGDYSTGTLEIYLNLTKTDPANQKHYFKKISEIYSHKGNQKEAERFLEFAGS